jgi:uncharacterized membrane protein
MHIVEQIDDFSQASCILSILLVLPDFALDGQAVAVGFRVPYG